MLHRGQVRSYAFMGSAVFVGSVFRMSELWDGDLFG